VGYNGAGELEYRLASDVQVSKDGKRYEFHLRPEARWSDGEPVRPEHFVAAFRHALEPSTASKTADILFTIRGAQALHSGKGKPEDLGVRAEGDKLVIELEKPASYFLHSLAMTVALPMKWEKWSEKAPVTGPYRIAWHKPEQAILLVPNENYWGYASHPGQFPPPVLLRIVHDESTAVSLFERGQLDIATKVPSYDFDRLKKAGKLRVDPFMATYFISFNTKKAPFGDRVFRRAVAGAIQREEIARAVGTGETPARSWIPRGLPGFFPYSDPTPVFADSVAAVRAKTRKQHLRVDAGFDSSSRNSMVMEKIQADLKSRIGIELQLKQMEWKSYVKNLGADAPPLWRFGALAPFKDPIYHLRFFEGDNPNNYTGWSDPEYNALVEEIAATPEGTARVKKILRAQQILVERDAVVVPIYHYVQTHAVATRVQGFRVSPTGVIHFKELSLAK
jgi:oligopeptide transport system substrate-binding protein